MSELVLLFLLLIVFLPFSTLDGYIVTVEWDDVVTGCMSLLYLYDHSSIKKMEVKLSQS